MYSGCMLIETVTPFFFCFNKQGFFGRKNIPPLKENMVSKKIASHRMYTKHEMAFFSYYWKIDPSLMHKGREYRSDSKP